jgi:hypothetical protein
VRYTIALIVNPISAIEKYCLNSGCTCTFEPDLLSTLHIFKNGGSNNPLQKTINNGWVQLVFCELFSSAIFLQKSSSLFLLLLHKFVEHGEGLQVLHYEAGQKYEPHFDSFDDDFNTKNGGQRIATLLMYLYVSQSWSHVNTLLWLFDWHSIFIN